MESNDLQRIWDRGREPALRSRQELADAFRTRVRSSAGRFRIFGIWIYAALPAIALALTLVNAVGYRSNAGMLVVLGVMAVFCLGILAYGISVAWEHARIERLDADLLSSVRRQIRFFGSRYTIWLWLAAFALVLLTLNVDFLTDNEGGRYFFSLSLDFVVVSIAQLVIAFGIFRLGQYATLREMKAVLSDLERQVAESTAQFDSVFKVKWRLWMIVAAIMGTLLLILVLASLLGASLSV